MKLTAKQKKFVDEYLIDLNATQAAIRAGYSKKAANRIASDNLSKHDIQQYLQECQKKLQNKTEITQERVINELASIAFSKGTDYATVKNGCVTIKDTDKLTENQKAVISGVKSTPYGVEIKLTDKLKALELIGKHIGMFKDKDDANANKTVEDDELTKSLEERAKKL